MLSWFVLRGKGILGWQVPTPVAVVATVFFLALDALLVAGCAIKFFDGGWFPLLGGAALFVLMSTWAHGRALLLASIQRDGLALEPFIPALASEHLPRAQCTAMYPVANSHNVPQALLHNPKHNPVLHVRNVVLTVVFHQQPWVAEAERLEMHDLGHGFWRVHLHFGFRDLPDVPRALALAAPLGLPLGPLETSYFLSRETVVPTGGLAGWRKRLFATLSRGAGSATQFFSLPDNAVVELGTRVQVCSGAGTGDLRAPAGLPRPRNRGAGGRGPRCPRVLDHLAGFCARFLHCAGYSPRRAPGFLFGPKRKSAKKRACKTVSMGLPLTASHTVLWTRLPAQAQTFGVFQGQR